LDCTPIVCPESLGQRRALHAADRSRHAGRRDRRNQHRFPDRFDEFEMRAQRFKHRCGQ
jgi:hypothetical protein